jgi:ribosomal protein S18 acetylase RimI-like enzyme
MRPLLESIRIEVLPANPRHIRELIEVQRRVYPTEMREREAEIRRILESSDMSLGIYKKGRLIGYALVRATQKIDTVYIYDIAILPEFQRQGLGTSLAREILTQARSRGLKVSLHVRSTSYPLFGNRDKMREMGYLVAKDELKPDWYFGEYGVHEDARELLLEPLTA